MNVARQRTRGGSSIRRILLLATTIVSGGVAGSCQVERDVPDNGYHPVGWADSQSSDFHAHYMRAHLEPLAECRVCHGADDQGGGTLVSCTTANCHSKGVEACGSCHGKGDDPRPRDAAHATHSAYCSECHPKPPFVKYGVHTNGTVDFKFSGAAVTNGETPTFDADTKTCANVDCHYKKTTAPWPSAEPSKQCDLCHQARPDSHARFGKAKSADCTTCHLGGDAHRNGHIDFQASVACSTCHGEGPLGVPPPAIDGSTSTSSRVVGAHRRHLDPTLSDRIGKVATCEDCHVVPATMFSPGHIDAAPPADVKLIGNGTYDPATSSCSVDCHFNRTPGPVWTDDSGDARACDACHGFPPVKTHKNTTHPSVKADLAECKLCHQFDPNSTHINGTVDFL
jgi:predicted CxxxxCH...CXXCH cytochrome family protein